jgi:hypothetical protein
MKNSNMLIKTSQVAVLAAGLGLAIQTQAALYDITFSGGAYTASGRIDVVNNSAVSGFLDVTYHQNATTAYTVAYNYLGLTDNGQFFLVENNNGDEPQGIGTGNPVYPNGNSGLLGNPVAGGKPVLDEIGLMFSTAPITGGPSPGSMTGGSHTAGAVINLSLDQTQSYITYNLEGWGNTLGSKALGSVPGFGYGDPNVDGSLTLTAVPEPTTVIAGALALLLPLAASTRRILRKTPLP